MAFIELLLTEADAVSLLARLSDDPEIAFLLREGPHRWRAHKRASGLDEGRYLLWHVPSGPLPLFKADPADGVDQVADPWLGWEELRPGRDRRMPYFGTGHPGTIELHLWPHGDPFSEGAHRGAPDYVGRSAFGWVGNRYGGATVETTRWWERLRRWVKREAIRIPDPASDAIRKIDAYAFPDAARCILEFGHRTKFTVPRQRPNTTPPAG